MLLNYDAAGLLSSWANPADNLPKAANFFCWRSLTSNSLERSAKVGINKSILSGQ